MFAKILIADRGETALRILRCCRALGIETVAAHSTADRDQDYVRWADEAVCIGPADPALSYGNAAAIISAAELTGADAIHPGRGPLSIDPAFAEAVEASGFAFVGPTPEQLSLVADRVRMRTLMSDAGVACIPCHGNGLPTTTREIAALASRVGFPVIVKAGADGSPGETRVVHSPGVLLLALNQLGSERGVDGERTKLHIERYLTGARHIEVQVLSDGRGGAIHLGMRDESIRHERRALLSEAPATGIDEDVAEAACRHCVDACRRLAFRGVASIKLLYDGATLHFLAMAPRLDSAAAATEFVTGVDIVEAQIRIAAGEPLPCDQREVGLDGHAIECVVNAEHPFRFTPSAGRISTFVMPGGPGIRVDSHCHAGMAIARHAPPVLIANVVAHASTRAEAIARMRRALAETIVEGVRTNVRLHQGIVDDEGFRRGGVHTGYLDQELAKRYRPGRPPREAR